MFRYVRDLSFILGLYFCYWFADMHVFFDSIRLLIWMKTAWYSKVSELIFSVKWSFYPCFNHLRGFLIFVGILLPTKTFFTWKNPSMFLISSVVYKCFDLFWQEMGRKWEWESSWSLFLLIFSAYGHGARGENSYQLEVDFLEPIDPSVSKICDGDWDILYYKIILNNYF